MSHKLKLTAAALIASGALLLGGCNSLQTTDSRYSRSEVVVDLVALTQTASAELLKRSALSAIDGRPILATSFVNIDNLTESSTLGRTLAELFVSGLSQQGIPVTEVKMREDLYIREKLGEMILSRQLDRLSQSHDAQAVLIGTYGIGGENIYVNARLVRTKDNLILGSQELTVPITQDIKTMIRAPRR